MDSLSRKLMKELEEMQQQTGRMLRSMSLARMMSLESGQWQPPVDVYESENAYMVYCDLAGTNSESLSVIVDENTLRISGTRELPRHEAIACVHQLEIELGRFARSISLPGPVDIDRVESTYVNGILSVTLPKKRRGAGKIHVTITSGDD